MDSHSQAVMVINQIQSRDPCICEVWESMVDQNPVDLIYPSRVNHIWFSMKPAWIPLADRINLKCPIDVSRLQYYPVNRLINELHVLQVHVWIL